MKKSNETIADKYKSLLEMKRVLEAQIDKLKKEILAEIPEGATAQDTYEIKGESATVTISAVPFTEEVPNIRLLYNEVPLDIMLDSVKVSLLTLKKFIGQTRYDEIKSNGIITGSYAGTRRINVK